MPYLKERDLPRKLLLYKENPDLYKERKRLEYAKNSEAIKQRVLRYYKIHKSTIRDRVRSRRSSDPEATKICDKSQYQKRRVSILKQKSQHYYSNKDLYKHKNRMISLRSYGLAIEQYEDMLQLQGGVCAICREAQKSKTGKRRLCVDHDHQTGAVRGLLCDLCNHALERLENHNGWESKAREYLRRPR